MSHLTLTSEMLSSVLLGYIPWYTSAFWPCDDGVWTLFIERAARSLSDAAAAAAATLCRDWISLSLGRNLADRAPRLRPARLVSRVTKSLLSGSPQWAGSTHTHPPHQPRPKPTPAERPALGHSRWFVNKFVTARTAIDFLSSTGNAVPSCHAA